MGMYLGGLLLEVKEIDTGRGGDYLGRFIRVRVLVYATKPLKRGLRVAFGKGEEVCNVMVCYERLPNFCYYCGLLGHLIRDCPANDKGLIDDKELRFGSWLRAYLPVHSKGKWGRNSNTGAETSSYKETHSSDNEDMHKQKDFQENDTSALKRDTKKNLLQTTTLDEFTSIQQHKVAKGKERCIPKNGKWKRVAREKSSIIESQDEEFHIGKRALISEATDMQESKRTKPDDMLTDIAVVAGSQHR
ncbi:hypothetical protein Q3G72_031192 [Acer saccharum]|nr:hypothetical protein Q3G72_031192 [Acer saccharum]